MPASKAKVNANARYNVKTYDNMNFRLRKDGGDGVLKDDVVKAAESCGESTTHFIVQAIIDRIESMK